MYLPLLGERRTGCTVYETKQTKVNANAYTQAQIAIAKAMKSSKTEVAGEAAFA